MLTGALVGPEATVEGVRLHPARRPSPWSVHCDAHPTCLLTSYRRPPRAPWPGLVPLDCYYLGTLHSILMLAPTPYFRALLTAHTKVSSVVLSSMSLHDLGGKFTLDITVPKEYPLHPPDVKFVTKVFHPNIHFKVRSSYLWTLNRSDRGHLPGLAEKCLVCHLYLAKHLPLNHFAACAPRTRQSSELRLRYATPRLPVLTLVGNLLRCGDIRGYNSMGRMYTMMYAGRSDPAKPSVS